MLSTKDIVKGSSNTNMYVQFFKLNFGENGGLARLCFRPKLSAFLTRPWLVANNPDKKLWYVVKK